jgi:flagellar protein FliS
MNAITQYEEEAITTQSRGQLIVMLYEGAIRFLRQAVIAIEAEDIRKKNSCISRAQDIIFELNTILDMETGGTIAHNLRTLYNFIWGHLMKANMSNDVRGIQDVIGLLNELLQGWKGIV